MKFVAYANERYLVIQTKYRSLCFLLTSTARCHNHQKFVVSCITGTQHSCGVFAVHLFYQHILELLGRFELQTSSLPNSSDCDFGRFPNLLRPFLSAGPCSPALLFPPLPSAHFPVWVTVWVKKLPPEYDAPTEDPMRDLATLALHAHMVCMRFTAGSCGHISALST